MPSFPFFALAAFCFIRSSKRLNTWFVGTKFYKENFEHFVSGKGMTVKTKVRVICLVTFTMGIGFFLMWRKGIVIGSITLACVWAGHMIYFIFGIKNYKENSDHDNEQPTIELE